MFDNLLRAGFADIWVSRLCDISTQSWKSFLFVDRCWWMFLYVFFKEVFSGSLGRRIIRIIQKFIIGTMVSYETKPISNWNYTMNLHVYCSHRIFSMWDNHCYIFHVSAALLCGSINAIYRRTYIQSAYKLLASVRKFYALVREPLRTFST